MLVLTRKCGEKIVLPQQELVLTVLAVRGERVRLGIVAPAHVNVHRHEVWERLQQQAVEAEHSSEPEPVESH
jgi:carbon storage regulator